MTPEELSGISVEDLSGTLLYGCTRLVFDDMGLVPGANDPDDLATIGTLAVLVNRYVEEGCVFDGVVCALAVHSAALIAAAEANLPVPHVVMKFRKNMATAERLQLAAM